MSVNGNKESINLIISGNLSIFKRVAEVKKRISEWTYKLEKDFNHETDQLRLKRFGKKCNKYFYQYTIERGVNKLKRNL
jgi:hypothetical protein